MADVTVIKLVKNADGDEDMVFENGVFEMAEDGTACAVQIKERLLLGYNEATDSVLVDTDKTPNSGTRWEETIWDSSKSREEKELEIKRVIFSAPGVKEITYWQWLQVSRTLTIDSKIKTKYGDLAFGESIQL